MPRRPKYESGQQETGGIRNSGAQDSFLFSWISGLQILPIFFLCSCFPDSSSVRLKFILMPIYQLERKQVVAMGLEDCWRFFSDPRNLEKITPPAMNFVIKRALPPEVYPGLMIEYTVSPLLGIPLTWLTEIVYVDAPRRFVDQQRVGPYRVWYHEHTFRETPGGGTEVHDLVTYVPPLGPFGAVLNALIVRPKLERIFDYRAQHLPGGRAQGSA